MAYVPHTEEDRREMLEAMGLESIEDLFQSVPEEIRRRSALDVPDLRTEPEIERDFGALAARNVSMDARPSFLGAGIYRRFVPAVVDAISSRGEFNTAYTPYQAEVSQGTLQAIMEYQTMIARLTGMEIANASMYDGATAVAEAVLMSYAVHKHGKKVIVSEGVHPEHRKVLETYLQSHPVEIVSLPLSDGVTPVAALEDTLRQESGDVISVVVQTPNFFGFLEDTKAMGQAVRSDVGGDSDKGGGGNKGGGGEQPLFITVVDPISLGILEPPGAHGADIVVGEGQQLGNPPSFGGPSFGFFATRERHVRKVPGRIVGETMDRDGKRGYVLTFQTREQHIRRERATSNICTNQGLCCLRGAIYLALMGRQGLREVAEASTRKAHHAHRALCAVSGVEAVSEAPFFQEFPLRLPLDAADAYRRLAEHGIGGGLPLGRYFPEKDNEMLFACTEMTSTRDIQQLVDALSLVVASCQVSRS